MAVLADNLDLRTNVVELVKNPSIIDVWGRILGMTEVRINRVARHRNQITSATVTFVDGEAPLPADFLEVLHLYDQSNCEMFAGPLSLVKGTGSMYRYYAIDGSSIWNYGYSGDRTLEYYASVPTISAALTDTNWLLASYPDVYLYIAAGEAAAHLQDTERASVFAGLADTALSDMHRDSNRARFSRGVVIPRGVNP